MSNRLSQLPLEVLVLSDAPIPARLSQLPLEVLHSAIAEATTAAQLSQLPLEVLVASPLAPAAAIRATQLVVELAQQPPAAIRATQLVVELVQQHPSAIHATQLLLEILRPVVPVPIVPITPAPGWLAWMEWPTAMPEARRRGRQPRSGAPWPIVAYSDWDLQDPPDYYHGFKQARVERFGEATRTLSEPRTGDWQGASCQFRLSDYDRLLRTKLASEDRYWTNGNFIVRMVTRPVRAVLGEALTVFVGPLRRADPVPPLSLEVTLEDVVGHGMLDDQHLIPQRVVDASYLPPDLVLDARAVGHPVPIIYGTHVRPHGAYAPVYLGIEDATQHVWLVAGHAAAVLDLLLDGVSVIGTDGVDWTVPGYSGPATEDYDGRRYTLLRGRVGTPPTPGEPVLYAENTGTAGNYFESWMVGRFVGLVFDADSHWDANDTTSPHAGSRALHGVDLRDGDAALGYFGRTAALTDPTQRGYWVNDYTSLVFWLKTETAGWVDATLQIRFMYGSPTDEHVLEAGIVVTLEDGLYGLDSFDTTTWQRIEIPTADFEVPTTAPPDRLYIFKGGDGELSVFIDDIILEGGEEIPGEITPADMAAAGTAAMTVNVSGWTTTGDDTGLVLAAIADQYSHFLVNYVAHPNGYQTGGPLANPESDLFDRVVTVVDEESFNVAKAIGIARYPPDGYLGHAILGATPGDRLPVRQWIARWNLSADVRFGISRYGQMFVVMHDPTATDLAEAPLVDEVLDILEGSFSIDMGWTSQATRVPFVAGYNWATGEWTVHRDAEDIALGEAYGRPEGIPGDPRDYWFIADTDQAKNVGEHEVQRIGHPPRVLQFETALGQLVTEELGRYIRVRHFAGVGPSAERLCQIEELTIAPGTRRLRMRALDVTDLIPEPEP